MKEFSLPAIAAAVFKDGAVIAAGACGKRRAGQDIPVEIEDRFHLGSDSKAFTSWLAGQFVAQGKLRWDSWPSGSDRLTGMREDDAQAHSARNGNRQSHADGGTQLPNGAIDPAADSKPRCPLTPDRGQPHPSFESCCGVKAAIRGFSSVTGGRRALKDGTCDRIAEIRIGERAASRMIKRLGRSRITLQE